MSNGLATPKRPETIPHPPHPHSLAPHRKSLQLPPALHGDLGMPQFDPRTLSSISDEELLELELDKDLPIEEWMLVEKERGRREERRRREAERARVTPPAS